MTCANCGALLEAGGVAFVVRQGLARCEPCTLFAAGMFVSALGMLDAVRHPPPHRLGKGQSPMSAHFRPKAGS